MKLKVNITTEDGEVVYQFFATTGEEMADVVFAGEIREAIEMLVDTEDLP